MNASSKLKQKSENVIRKVAAESEKWPDRKLRYKDFPQFCNCTHLFGQPDFTIRLHAISTKRSTDLQELYTDELMLALRNVVLRIFKKGIFQVGVYNLVCARPSKTWLINLLISNQTPNLPSFSQRVHYNYPKMKTQLAMIRSYGRISSGGQPIGVTCECASAKALCNK